MAEPKDTTSFFRKVRQVRGQPGDGLGRARRARRDKRDSEFAKGELKAMIERKRRNDFVRKREFDMLRKIRREGLSGDQLAALTAPRAWTTRAALSDSRRGRTWASRPRSTRSSSRWWATATPARSAARPSSTTRRPQPAPLDLPAPAGAAVAPPPRTAAGSRTSSPSRRRRRPRRSPAPRAARRGVARRLGRADPPRDAARPRTSARRSRPTSTEVTHDPDLDEAVIAFANADFDSASRPCRR